LRDLGAARVRDAVLALLDGAMRPADTGDGAAVPRSRRGRRA
jgi:hypothetical protein